MMRFYFLHAMAWARGLFRRWPDQGDVPRGYSSVSCGLRTLAECQDMYALGWEPWRYQLLPRTWGEARISRLFRVPMSPEEIAYDQLVDSHSEPVGLESEYDL